MNKKLQNKIITAAGIVVALGVLGYGIYWRIASLPARAPVNEEIAACLKSKDIKFYGTYYCPHCQEQKEILGGYLNSINYIECTQDPGVCTENNIQVVPTWIFPDGTRKEGVLKLGEILQLSNCQLNQ